MTALEYARARRKKKGKVKGKKRKKTGQSGRRLSRASARERARSRRSTARGSARQSAPLATLPPSGLRKGSGKVVQLGSAEAGGYGGRGGGAGPGPAPGAAGPPRRSRHAAQRCHGVPTPQRRDM